MALVAIVAIATVVVIIIETMFYAAIIDNIITTHIAETLPDKL